MKIKNNLSAINDFHYLIRFINFPKLLDLIMSDSFYFARLDSFKDKSEAISNQQLIKHFYPTMWRTDSEKKELTLKTRQKRYYATCWFGNNRESFSMWNLYSDPISVALKFDLGNFNDLWHEKNLKFEIDKEWINTIYINKIDYKDYFDGKQIFKKKKEIIGLFKDLSYVDEKEVRVLIKCRGKLTKSKTVSLSGAKINFIRVSVLNLKKIPFKVLFHPEMKNNLKLNIKSLIQKYGYKNIKCESSELTKLLKFDKHL